MIELPTLTNQEIFNRVVNHLIKQGKAAHGPAPGGKASEWTCRYLMANGCRCAVGCLMKDDPQTNAIALRLDGKAYDTRLFHRRENGERVSVEFGDLLDFKIQDSFQHALIGELQDAHDDSRHSFEFVADFCNRARQVAQRYKLDHSTMLIKE